MKATMKAQLIRANTPSAGLVRVPAGTIERRIHFMQSQRVMLDSDLAKLYHVSTKAFNQAVKRNQDRFPKDFMFQLTPNEAKSLRSQPVTLEENAKGRGRHAKYAPHVFTEHGIAMLSSILRSKRAVQMNIQIIRAFIRIREITAHHKDLADRVDKLEMAQQRHVSVIKMLAEEIDEIKNPPVSVKRSRIGFRPEGG
jgi:ORF6N domain